MLYTNFGQGVRRFFAGLSLLLAVVILVKSLIPALPGLSINNGDKYVHVLAYLVLGAAVLPACPRIRPVLVWLGVAGFGAGVEIMQGLLDTGRSADIYDGIANALGALLAIGFWLVISRLMAKSSGASENDHG